MSALAGSRTASRRLSSASWRSPAAWLANAASRAASDAASSETSNSSSAAMRGRRRSRSGSSRKMRSETGRTTPSDEVGEAAGGVDERPVVEARGHRVEREVAPAQVLLQRAGEPREVDRAGAVDHAPRAVALAERERGAARLVRQRAGRRAGVALDQHVPVEHRPLQQQVAHRAADQPAALQPELGRDGAHPPGELLAREDVGHQPRTSRATRCGRGVSRVASS